jgi:hypothetical protein
MVASAGMAFTALGLLMLAFTGMNTHIAFILLSLMVLGFGFALFSSPNTNAVMGSVEKRYYGVASGMLGTMRLTGQMFSMGITTLVFAVYMGRTQISPANYHLFVGSMQVIFAIMFVLCFTGIFASLARGKARGSQVT